MNSERIIIKNFVRLLIVFFSLSFLVLCKKHDANYYFNKGNQYLREASTEKAIESYKMAIQLDASYTNKVALTFSNLGYALIEKKEYEGAYQSLELAIEFNPKLAIAYMNLGDLFFKIQKYDDSIASFKKAIELEPQNPGFHYGLALVYEKLDKKNEAIYAAKRCIEVSPESVYHKSAEEIIKKYQLK